MAEQKKRGPKPRNEVQVAEANTPAPVVNNGNRISISRAIGRAQVIEKRIERLVKEIGQRAYIVSNTFVPGFSTTSLQANHKDLTNHITSSQQELMDLVAEATKIRKAIAESNNTVVLEIGSYSMTVAQWIYFQNSIVPYLVKANSSVEQSYATANSSCELKNAELRQALGVNGKPQELMGNEYTVVMAIPEGIRDSLAIFSSEFKTEIKTRIHESNSLEMIEI